MSKKLKILLFISIILNVLLIGVMIGHISTRFLVKKHFKGHFPEISRELPAEKQEMLADAMMKLHRQSSGTKRKIHRVRKEIVEILTAPEFDEQLYDKKVAELHNLHGEMAMGLSEVTKKLAVKFTPSERRVLAEILRRKPHRRPRDRFDRPFRHRPNGQERTLRHPPDREGFNPDDF
jgi:uncharacterized membrane protein